MKHPFKIICLAVLMGLLAFTAKTAFGADEMTTIKNNAQKQCDAINKTIGNYLNNLNSSPSKYPGLAMTIDVHTPVGTTDYRCILNNLIAGLNTKINDVSTTLNTYCKNAASADSPTNANYYLQQISDFNKNTIPILAGISKLDAYYSAYNKVGINANLIYSFKNQHAVNGSKPFLDSMTTKQSLSTPTAYILGTDYSFSHSFMESIATSAVGIYTKASSQNLCWINPDLLSAVFGDPSKLKDWTNDLSAKKNNCDSLNRNADTKLATYMNDVMIETAKDSKVLSSENSNLSFHQKYDDLLDKYNSDRDKMAATLNKNIESLVTLMDSYVNKIADPKMFNNLSPDIATTLQTRASWGLTQLGSARRFTVDTYNHADSSTKAVDAFNIKNVLVKNIDLAAGFNKSYGKVADPDNGLQAVCFRFLNSYSLLRKNLKKPADQQTLDSLYTSFNIIYPTVKTGVNNNLYDKSAIETAIKNNALDGANSTTIKILNDLLQKYSQNLSAASQKISQYRSQWWPLITEASIEGTIKRADFDASQLSKEQKAAQVYGDYEKKRADYMAKAKALIDSRVAVITSNQDLMTPDKTPNIPAGGIKDAFTAKLDTLLSTNSEVNYSLDAYYRNQILAQNNYNDLIVAVNGIKTTFKLNEVVIPLQKLYLQLDKYYGNELGLYSVMYAYPGGLNSLITALGSKVTREITTLQGTIKLNLQTLYNPDAKNNSDLEKMNSDMVTALGGPGDSGDETMIKSINTEGSAISSEISSIKNDETKLLQLINTAKNAK